MRPEPLVVRSGTASARAVTDYVTGLARAGGLRRRQAYRLRLAADEITTNIGLHGYRGTPGPVRLEGGWDDKHVWLAIEDEAPPFDPREHDTQPRLEEGIAGGREGGFGLFLALGGLDEFQYEQVDGHNRNVLIIQRSTVALAELGERDAYQCSSDRR